MVLHLFPLRGDLDILSYLWMIFFRYTWIYLLYHRFEFVSIYKTFHKMIETQFNRIVKVFRSNNAQEYNDKSFLSFLDNHWTLTLWSCPYISQQNGCAKWKHCHILHDVCTLLIFASILQRFWGEAALTAVYTINQIPSPTTHIKSPFRLLYGQTPDYFSLWVFRCDCFVSLSPHEGTKLQPRAHLCCFLGYGVSQKGFHCYDPISHCLCVSRYVKFWEHCPFTSL